MGRDKKNSSNGGRWRPQMESWKQSFYVTGRGWGDLLSLIEKKKKKKKQQTKTKNRKKTQLRLQLLFTDYLKEVGEEVFKYNEYNFALKLTNKQTNETEKGPKCHNLMFSLCTRSNFSFYVQRRQT